jgi:hypothetical protein
MTTAFDFCVDNAYNAIIPILEVGMGAPYVTPEREQAILEAYLRGEPAVVISKSLHTTNQTIYRILKKHGVKLKVRYLDEAERLAIRDEYLGGMSQVAIGRLHGIDPAAVRYTLRKLGVPPRSLSDAFRKHALNEAAFDCITEASAYWAGMLMADGSIRMRKGRPWGISLVLSAKDRGHVEKFRSFVGSTHAISIHPVKPSKRFPRGTSSARFSITSLRLAARLADFGVVTKKSLTAKVSLLEGNRHFWRGVVDGDGYISIHRAKTLPHCYASFGVAGSKDLMEQFAEFLGAKIASAATKACKIKGTTIWAVRLTGESAFGVIRLLYGRCKTYLERKMQRALFLLEHCDKHGKLPGRDWWFPEAPVAPV